jgi:hypothetical protein
MKTEHLIDDRTCRDKQQLDRACTRFPMKHRGEDLLLVLRIQIAEEGSAETRS